MKKYIKAGLLFVWMALIFFLSAQPGNDSLETSNKVAELFYSIYALIIPKEKLMDIAQFLNKYIEIIRAFAHYTEFLILGVLTYITFKDYFKEKNLLIYSLLFSILYAITDEIHQLFVVNRYCSVNDMFVDALGCITGVLLIHLIYCLCRKYAH